MEVHLTPDQEAFIQQRVRNGRFATADDAVREALSLLEERERRNLKPKISDRKSLAQLFAESPFKGLDIEFPRDKDPLRPLDL
jgi:putative addiction module CopG family antidote